MPRTLTNAQLQALYAQSTKEVFLTLLTLSHPDFDADINWVDNTEQIISNGVTYLPAPIRIVLPNDQEDKGPQARIAIDNVDRVIVQRVRSVSGRTKISANFHVIMASTPDDVIASYTNFKMSNIGYNQNTVGGDLTLSDFLSEPYPGDTFNPSTTPAIF